MMLLFHSKQFPLCSTLEEFFQKLWQTRFSIMKEDSYTYQ